MPLILTPHTITIAPAIQNVSGGRANAVTYGTPYTVLGQITPASASADWLNFGVQTTENYKMLLNISDAAAVKVGDLVTCQGSSYKVAAKPKLSQAGLITDHASISLEQVDQ